MLKLWKVLTSLELSKFWLTKQTESWHPIMYNFTLKQQLFSWFGLPILSSFTLVQSRWESSLKKCKKTFWKWTISSRFQPEQKWQWSLRRVKSWTIEAELSKNVLIKMKKASSKKLQRGPNSTQILIKIDKLLKESEVLKTNKKKRREVFLENSCPQKKQNMMTMNLP